jgi:hypothetical protein
LFPGHANRGGTRTGEQGFSTGDLDHLRYPVPTVERRITPFQRKHAGPVEPINGGSDPREPTPQAVNDLLGTLLDPGDLPDLQHAVEDVVQRTRIQRDHLGLATQDL